MVSVADFLNAPASLDEIDEQSTPSGGLSKEAFKELDTKVKLLKLRIEKGETLDRQEAREITIWFRARRVEAFTVAALAVKKPKKASGVLKKRKVTAEEKQQLGDALINAL